jgi:hypothetical protein
MGWPTFWMIAPARGAVKGKRALSLRHRRRKRAGESPGGDPLAQADAGRYALLSSGPAGGVHDVRRQIVGTVVEGGMGMEARELRLDYFKIYDVEDRPAQADILLQGQFDKRALKMRLALLDFFGNPVSKNGEPIFDKNAHLSWYRGAQAAEPMRRVVVENQFGKFDIRTGTGYGLLVPSQKVEAGSEFPKALDHYKVYRLVDVEQVPDVKLKLRDQFGSDEVALRLPMYFAVPVVKTFGEKKYPIQNPRAHLLIFGITPRDSQRKIVVRNQFARGITVPVVRSVMLAAPSLKIEWKPE